MIAVGLYACGGGGYDAEYDCEQTAACCSELGSTPTDSTINTCKDNSQKLYDSLDDPYKEAADEITERCKDKTACDYLECTINSRACPW